MWYWGMYVSADQAKLRPWGLSQTPGRPIPHRPEEPVLDKQDTQHRLFTAVRKHRPLLPAISFSQKFGVRPRPGTALHLDRSAITTSAGRWLPWLVIVGLAVSLRVLQLGVFYTRDEMVVWRWTDQFFAAIWRGDLAGTNVGSDYPGIPAYWLQLMFNLVRYPGWLSAGSDQATWVEAILALPRLLPNLADRRLAMGLATAAQVLGLYALTVKAFGQRVALLAAFLIASEPFLLAESRVFRLEALAGGFMAGSLLAWLAFVRVRRSRYLVLSGVLAGWAILSKTSSLFLLPIIGSLILADAWLASASSWPQRLLASIRRGLVWLGAALAACWITWPALWVAPGPALDIVLRRGLLQTQVKSSWHGDIFFLGQLWPGDPGPLFYPVVLGFRTTPLMWLGILLTLVAMVLACTRGRRLAASDLSAPHGRPCSAQWTGIASLLYYCLVILVGCTLIISKVERYLLPMFPALDILTALGLVWAAEHATEWLKASKPGWLRHAPYAALIALCALHLTYVLSTFPYFYTFWNPLLGGGAAAVKVLPVGSGEGLEQAIAPLNQMPNAQELTLVCGASRGWCEGQFVGTTWSDETLGSGEWIQADYVLLYISRYQRQMYPQGVIDYLSRQPPVLRVDLGGASYAWLYRVPQVQYYSGTRLEGRSTLLGYNVSAAQLRAGDTLSVTLYWRNWGGQPGDRMFVRVVDAADYVWADATPRPRAGFEQAATTYGAVVESETWLHIPVGTPPGHYLLKMGIETGDDRRLVGWFELPANGDDVQVTRPEVYPPAEQIDVPGTARLETDDIRLLGYALSPMTVSGQATGWLTLYWQALKDAPRDCVVGIQLRTESGQEQAYWLGRPVYSGYPTYEWRLGQIVQDPWRLSVASDVPAGNYWLHVTVFDSVSGQPLASTRLTDWQIVR